MNWHNCFIYLGLLFLSLTGVSKPNKRAPGPNVKTFPLHTNDYLALNILEKHNIVRKAYGVGPLVYRDNLAYKAAESASKNAATCAMTHNGNENLYTALYLQHQDISFNPRSLVENAITKWASEEETLRKDTTVDLKNTLRIYGSDSQKWRMVGHLQQMVWKNSKEVGCAYADRLLVDGCNLTLVVACEYYPPGNVIGRTYDGKPAVSRERRVLPSNTMTQIPRNSKLRGQNNLRNQQVHYRTYRNTIPPQQHYYYYQSYRGYR